jgi:3-deoxy-D-manno-octulosonic-acid transferase
MDKLIRNISKNCDITVSSGTETGYKTALKRYPISDKILFSPYDFPFSVKSFINCVNPKIFIIAEAEFWYNLYFYLGKKDIPIWIINFRVGNKKAYLRLKFYYKRIFKFIDKFFIPSKDYIEFLKAFGVDESKIVFSGNLKADISYNEIDIKERANIKKRLKLTCGKKIFIAGSTSAGEEEELVKTIKKYKMSWKFIIVPRHIERAVEVKRIAEKNGFKTEMITNLKNNNYDILIVNTIGELFKIYSIADLAFVGGSLVPSGGHNILEPIFHSVPTITGKFYKNFKELVDTIKQKGGLAVVDKATELSPFFEMDAEELKKLGETGKKALNEMKGAVEIILKELEKTGVKCY